MPDVPPEGVFPLFIRGNSCEKFGFKVGQEYVDYVQLSKEDILKEIRDFGVMSDFEPARKQIEISPGDKLLFVVDKEQKYGEMFLLYYSESSKEKFMLVLRDKEYESEKKRQEEVEAEEARRIAENARLNVVFEDVPLSARAWNSSNSTDTEAEVKLLNPQPVRERLAVDIFRTKKSLRQTYRFTDISGLQEFRAHKDPHFTTIRESEIGIQAAPSHTSSHAQTTWYRKLNKSVQYEPAAVNPEPTDGDEKDNLCEFLETATIKIEEALQQNETVDIFHETFRFTADDEVLEGPQAENEMRELKNFADPTYSKFKVLAAIDWMPKVQGMVAVSAVRNMTFDERITVSGQTHTSYVLIWDFRQLVKPQVLLQSPHEVFTFRFNPSNPNIVVGGCLTGQILLWDITEVIAAVNRKGTRGASSSGARGRGGGMANPETTDEDDASAAPLLPKWISNVDHSHKRAVADMLWLPPNTQINHRGQLVSEDFLDGSSHQFITVAGDGQVIVWDTRYESIANDELRHIARSKHAFYENGKTPGKDGAKPLWTPVFKAHLKRVEGVGELSLCKISGNVGTKSAIRGGDPRSQFMVATEEGDILLTDLSTRKMETINRDDDDEDVSDSKEFVRWIAKDLPRPSVCLQHSPFFHDILISVGDLKFNIWKIGELQPLFTSPLAHSYLTGAAWSPTRPAVLILSCADGSLLVWDFTDSSYRHSLELKATHSRISAMEFLPPSTSTSRQQLLAVGDVTGTLHIFDIPRNLARPVHREEVIMSNFFERELKRVNYLKENRTLALASGSSNQNEEDKLSTTFDSAPTATATQTQPNRSDASSATNDDSKTKGETTDSVKKEEDEFARLEALFISELSLSSSELPGFLKVNGSAPPPAVVSTKDSKRSSSSKK